MKLKITALLLLIAMLCTMLTSCVVVEIIELINNVWGLVFSVNLIKFGSFRSY